MKLPAVVRAWPGPVSLVLVLAVLASIALVSPGHPGRTSRDDGETAAMQQLIPVRLPATTERQAVRGERVALRQLIIATDADDFELPVWKAILDGIGTPYDVLFAKYE